MVCTGHHQPRDGRAELDAGVRLPSTGQRVNQGWSATWTQSGTRVTAASASWNGSLGTGASTSIGFAGAWSSTNPVPASFSLNGAACTGSVITPSASVPPSTPPVTTPPPGGPAPALKVSGNKIVTADGRAYRLLGVKDYVDLLVANGINVILDLHWTWGAYTTGPDWHCTDEQATCQKPAPDARYAPQFWTGVATTFKGNNAVVFDLFNEPYPEIASDWDKTAGWTCLRDGGTCTGTCSGR
ncbi:cellulose binding domain-containing protein [Actinoplanes sp. NPDC049599]|uniref:cellulose binding domain-containing protein n=1 Tax=Actinoplanes sp. NPDC049599 TaxID=3363903 RepID=UPI0037B87C58